MNIRESIRTILKEETKFEKLVKQQVKDHGLSRTAKMMGISKYELVNLVKVPIDSEFASELLYENLSNGVLKNTYKEFKITANHNGVFNWSSKLKTGYFSPDFTERIYVMATPFWDGGEYTPVELDWVALYDENGNKISEQSGDGYIELNHQSSFEDIDELLTWYDEFYLPNVYDVIMNDLLPKFYNENDLLRSFYKGKD